MHGVWICYFFLAVGLSALHRICGRLYLASQTMFGRKMQLCPWVYRGKRLCTWILQAVLKKTTCQSITSQPFGALVNQLQSLYSEKCALGVNSWLIHHCLGCCVWKFLSNSKLLSTQQSSWACIIHRRSQWQRFDGSVWRSLQMSSSENT